MSVGVLDLSDVSCHDVSVAGGKAAWLSRAGSLGLPVLPGFVVTTAVGSNALAGGSRALARRGSGGARLAVQSAALTPALTRRLAEVVEQLGAPVIVRSSVTVEAAGEWSGAFSSFSDVDAGNVATAVKGCWASLFGVDALERAEHAGLEADDVGVAVLVQPQVDPRLSGHARVDAAGRTVTVTAVEGPPAALMSGWVRGDRVTVTPDGAVDGNTVRVLTDAECVAVADVARDCLHHLGHRSIEWALVGDDVVLLQTTHVADDHRHVHAHGVAELAELDTPMADRVAELARRFPGGASEELVLPWAFGLRDLQVVDVALRAPTELPTDLATLRGAARDLARQVWAGADGGSGLPWAGALRALRSDHPARALDLLTELRVPPAEEVTALVQALVAYAVHASARGLLRRPGDLFGCELADLDPNRAPSGRQSWAGARRWEPFLAAVAQTRGRSTSGLPAAGGLGAGPAHVVIGPGAGQGPAPARSVVVAEHPVPALASLLWDAAGLVTVQGSAGAHLVEVARSLGVPAVVQCAQLPTDTFGPAVVVAVDGDGGRVSWLTPIATPAAPAGRAG